MSGANAGFKDSVGELAASLVKESGLEGAVCICRSNHWHGVLRKIESDRGILPGASEQGAPVGNFRA